MPNSESYHHYEELQRLRFDKNVARYAAHHGDFWSQAYRQRFYNEPMLGDIDLTGAEVVDALCGSGETTGYLLEKGARVTGIDISREEIKNFQNRFPNSIGKCASIFSTGLKSDYYNCVVVVGGLHHLHPYVCDAIKEIHRILKRGGLFCFTEPHKGSIPDIARKLWYKMDDMFAKNENSIDIAKLKNRFSAQFEVIKEEYKGSIAYPLVCQSLITRIPLRLKPIFSPWLIDIESKIEMKQNKLFSCFVVCRWQKK